MHTSIFPVETASPQFNLQSKLNRRSAYAPLYKRLAGLENVLQKLQAGQFVSNRSLGRHLTEEEFKDYISLCQQQRNLREKLKTKPAEVEAYQRDLKRADFNAIQAISHQEQGDMEKAAAFFELSQKQNLTMLNRLKQQILLQPGLQDWFDRPVLEVSDQALTTETMPRAVTSFSRFKLENHPVAIISVAKQDLKIKAIRDAHQLLLATLSQSDSMLTHHAYP